MTIRIPKAVLAVFAVLALLAGGGAAGYLLGHDSDASAKADQLRDRLERQHADLRVHGLNVVVMAEALCRRSVRFENQVGTQFSGGECRAINELRATPPFRIATIDRVMQSAFGVTCNNIHLAQGESIEAADFDCTRDTELVPSEAERLEGAIEALNDR